MNHAQLQGPVASDLIADTGAQFTLVPWEDVAGVDPGPLVKTNFGYSVTIPRAELGFEVEDYGGGGAQLIRRRSTVYAHFIDFQLAYSA